MEAIIYYLLKSAGILAIFFFSYNLFLKKETFFTLNRHYLLVGILGALLLPLVIFTKYIYVEPVTQTLQPSWLMSDIPITYNMDVEPEPFDWLLFGTYIYIIGVLVFAFRFVIQLISLFKLLTTHTIKKEDGFNLVKVNTNISPFSFFNYIVYNPGNYNRKDLYIIINHEKAHGNQLHSVDILLSQMILILQWCNPFAWYYKRSIQQNLEYMADQFAVSKVESAKQYQHTLLKASLKPQYASITNNFYNSLIKKRIIMLNQTKSKIINAWKYFIIFPVLALFLMSFNVKTVEIVKEPESNDFTTTSDLLFFEEDNLIPNEEKQKETTKTNTFASKIIEPEAAFLQKIIETKITKNTTDAELKEIKKSLKNEGIDFNYKNVKRNDQNEITGINVSYKDKEGNTGNYALSSDSPISTFYFFKNEDGNVGFKSDNMHPEHRLKWVEAKELSKEKREALMRERKEFREQQKAEMMKEREYRLQERMKMMEERQALSKERQKEVEERAKKYHVERKEEMKKIKKELQRAREEHEEQRKLIIKERIKLRDSLKGKQANIFIHEDEDKLFFPGKHKALIIVDDKIVDEETIEILKPESIAHINVIKGEKALEAYGKKGKNGVVIIETKPHLSGEYKYRYKVKEPNVGVIVDSDDESDVQIRYEIAEYKDEPNIKIYGKGISVGSNAMLLKKSASDEHLKSMKSFFKENGIDFKYNKLKRNKDGEITRIKILLNDNKGNKSSATFDKGDKGINPILIGQNKNGLTIKSM